MRPFLTSTMFALAALASPALAGPAPAAMSPTAAPYLERGLRFYATQRYREALAEFRSGYELDPHGDFLYAIGQAERLGGNCAAAVAAYRAYLRTEPPELEATKATGQIERCEAQHHAAAPPPRAHEFGTTGYAMVSGGALALGIGAGFLIAGRQHASDASRARTLADRDAHATTARNYRIAGGVSLVGGAVLGTLAVLRYLRADAREARPGTPTVTAAVGSEEVYVAAVVQF